MTYENRRRTRKTVDKVDRPKAGRCARFPVCRLCRRVDGCKAATGRRHSVDFVDVSTGLPPCLGSSGAAVVTGNSNPDEALGHLSLKG